MLIKYFDNWFLSYSYNRNRTHIFSAQLYLEVDYLDLTHNFSLISHPSGMNFIFILHWPVFLLLVTMLSSLEFLAKIQGEKPFTCHLERVFSNKHFTVFSFSENNSYEHTHVWGPVTDKIVYIYYKLFRFVEVNKIIMTWLQSFSGWQQRARPGPGRAAQINEFNKVDSEYLI